MTKPEVHKRWMVFCYPQSPRGGLLDCVGSYGRLDLAVEAAEKVEEYGVTIFDRLRGTELPLDLGVVGLLFPVRDLP